MPGVLIHEPLAGCIKWLPRKHELIPPDPEIDAGCCNHPVVTLSSQPTNGRVEILIITSFGGLDLETKYPFHQLARNDHLPIAPNKAHPDNGTLLVLRDPLCELRKKSYVKTKNRRSVLLASLQPYNRLGPEIYLSTRSYQTLAKYINFSEPQAKPTLYLPISVRGQEVARPIGSQHSGTANHVAYVLNYNSRYLTPSSAAIAASRTERQPLLLPPDIYRPHQYRNYSTLPTTRPVTSTYYRQDSSISSDSNETGPCEKIFVVLLLASFILFAIYLGAARI